MNMLSAILFVTLLALPEPAAAPGEKTFDSARGAADALVQAVGSDDTTTMLAIFGPPGKKIVE